MNNTKKGIIYIILAAFFFAAMNVFVKLSGDIPSIQKSFFRNLLAAIFALGVLIKNKEDFKYQKKIFRCYYCVLCLEHWEYYVIFMQ